MMIGMKPHQPRMCHIAYGNQDFTCSYRDWSQLHLYYSDSMDGCSACHQWACCSAFTWCVCLPRRLMVVRCGAIASFKLPL